MRFRGIPVKKFAIGLLLLIAFGAARLPLERGITSQLRQQEFLDDNVDLTLMDELGQGSFAAALGGFRSLVASGYYLIAHVNGLEKNDWAKLDQQYGLITTLQPRNSHYWDQYIWHIGWNAYGQTLREAEYQEKLGNDMQAWKLKNVIAPGFLKRAEEIALKGVRLAPDDYRLHQRIGWFYEDKLNNVCEGSRWYASGAALEDAPSYMANIAAILLAKCEGAEDEAYPLIRSRYYSGDPRDRTLSIYIQMESLEDRLSRRELARSGIDQLHQLAADDPENYLHPAAIALHHFDAGESERAMRIYEKMISRYGEKLPEFYRKKWALAAAGVPGREKAAYQILIEELKKTRHRLLPEEAAIVRPLEEMLKIPENERLFVR